MTLDTGTRRPTVRGRRAGYVVAILLNALMLYAVNRWPGWESLGFLTDRTPEVLGLVNASMLVSLVANVAYLWRDGPRVRALGDLVGTLVGAAAMVRIWQVFPFDFDTTAVPWDLVARWVIGVGIFGCIVAIIVALVRFVRALVAQAGR